MVLDDHNKCRKDALEKLGFVFAKDANQDKWVWESPLEECNTIFSSELDAILHCWRNAAETVMSARKITLSEWEMKFSFPMQRDLILETLLPKLNNIEGEQAWINACNQQGWGDELQIIHLEGFLRKEGLFDKFGAYVTAVAAEKNSTNDAGEKSPRPG